MTSELTLIDPTFYRNHIYILTIHIKLFSFGSGYSNFKKKKKVKMKHFSFWKIQVHFIFLNDHSSRFSTIIDYLKFLSLLSGAVGTLKYAHKTSILKTPTKNSLNNFPL